ncbi:MAG: Uma2 family endonuclease, partial [Symploca sp. SIO3E6]|nr:Uma2 family endonuclease [Caldora sp. SIO3E6]
MPLTQDVESVDVIPQDIIFPPSDLESNEPPLESDLHRDQIDLLIRLLRWFWQERNDF